MDRKKYDLSLDRKENEEGAPFEISAIGERRYLHCSTHVRGTHRTPPHISLLALIIIGGSQRRDLSVDHKNNHIYLSTVQYLLYDECLWIARRATGLALAFCQSCWLRLTLCGTARLLPRQRIPVPCVSRSRLSRPRRLEGGAERAAGRPQLPKKMSQLLLPALSGAIIPILIKIVAVLSLGWNLVHIFNFDTRGEWGWIALLRLSRVFPPFFRYVPFLLYEYRIIRGF